MTNIIQQITNGTYQFASLFVDKGTFAMWSFDEQPYSFSVPVPVNKATKSCSVDAPLECHVNSEARR